MPRVIDTSSELAAPALLEELRDELQNRVDRLVATALQPYEP
jgi:hypothetical protein